MAIALDTLDYARRLRESGFSEEQAEGQARALAAAMTDALATKEDLKTLDADIDARFAQVDARFAQVDARFTQVDARFDALEKHVDARFDDQESRMVIRLDEQEKRMVIRLDEMEKRFDAKLAGGLAQLETRLIRVMVGSVVLVSVLVKLL